MCGSNHQEIKPFLAPFLVERGKQHAVALHAHHGSGRQVRDGDQRLSDELLRLVECVDSAEDHALLFRPVVQDELEELLALRHGLALQDFYGAEVGLAEGLKVHIIREERLDLHLAEVDGLRRRRKGICRCRGLFGVRRGGILRCLRAVFSSLGL